MELTVLLQALDSEDFTLIGLDGEHGAGLHCLAIEQYGASAAVSCVAADVRASEVKHLADEFHQQQPRLNF
jgi:hypothetical protein